MARYTTEVRTVCEYYAGLDAMAPGSRVNDVIETAREKVFDFDFPVFDESYRSVIETKILRHYYTREIGFETVGLWKLKLETRLNEVMPYFNQLYESTLLEFNPFYDVDLTVTHEGSGTDDTGQTSKSSDAVDGKSVSDTSTNRNVTTVVDGTAKTDSNGKVVETPNITVGTGNTEASESESKETVGRQHDVTNSSDDSWKLYSETPQQTLAGIQGRKVVPGSTAASVAGEDGKYYVADITTFPPYIYEATYYEYASDSPLNQTKILVSPQTASVIYFAIDNKLYMHKVTTGEDSVVKTFAQGENISFIKNITGTDKAGESFNDIVVITNTSAGYNVYQMPMIGSAGELQTDVAPAYQGEGKASYLMFRQE